MAETPLSFPNCRFYVEIEQTTVAVFTEVAGLQLELEVLEYQEGGENAFVHRLPGRMKVGNLTLKRGLIRSGEFFDWFLAVARGQVDRRNVSVYLYDAKGEVVATWEFVKAYPVKWIGPQLTADGKVAAIETLELAHQGLNAGNANAKGVSAGNGNASASVNASAVVPTR